MELRDATVLLTGATGGIGQAIAHTMHAQGAKLILTGRRDDVLDALAAEVDGRAVVADLAEPRRGRPARRRLRRRRRPGRQRRRRRHRRTPSTSTSTQIDHALDVNLRAPMVLAQALGAQMAERGRGHIVLISSLSGIAGSPRSSLYNATKFGLRGFGQGLRSDLRDHGVGVSVVFPGFIRDAGMFADSGVKLPFFVGTSSPQQVADGVVSAIVRNRGEVVGRADHRADRARRSASLVPDFAADLQRRLGSERLADAMTDGPEGLDA